MSNVRTVTVPADGQTEWHGAQGLSVIILECDTYQDVTEAPKMQFDTEGANWPIEPRNILPNDQCLFKRVGITGTAKSAGSEVKFLPLMICPQPVVNPNNVRKSIAGATQTKAASDAVQDFSDLELQDGDGNLPKRLYVWVAGGTTAGINFAYNADPSQGLNATDAIQWDNDQSNSGTADHSIQVDLLEIVGIDWIQKFRFRATVAGETPNVIWTPEY